MQAQYITPTLGRIVTLTTDHPRATDGRPVLVDGNEVYTPDELTREGRMATWHLAAVDEESHVAMTLRAKWEAQLSLDDLVRIETLNPCDAWREARYRGRQ